MASQKDDQMHGSGGTIRPGGDIGRHIASLDPELWKVLTDARRFEELAGAWLTIQCKIIADVVCAAIVLVEAGDEGARRVITTWPEGTDAGARLADAITVAQTQASGVTRKIASEDGIGYQATQIAYPITLADVPINVIALEIKSRSTAQVRNAMRQLQWGSAWLREHLERQNSAAKDRALGRMSGALEILALSLEEERFAAACRACVTQLANAQSCNRVSIGFVKGGRVRVESISNSAAFRKNLNVVRLVGAAMDEAVDQQAVILHPPPDGDICVTRAHGELAEALDGGAILTTPLFVGDAFVGAITFERSDERPFDQETIEYLEGVASVVGPVLEVKRRDDRWIISKIGEDLARLFARLFGPGHLLHKLVILVAVILVSTAYFATGVYQITANADVEGKVQRAIVAPFNGFIKEAHVRAGDTVTKDQILASLDNRDLVLERLRWVTEQQKKLYEYQQAIGEHDRAAAKIADAEREQADAQIKLIDEQLARTVLRAPFSGLVVAGDLSQVIGASVERGQALFRIAPLDAYRVILKIDESQIGDVDVGDHGVLRVTSLPNEDFPMLIEKITPVADIADGRNVFRVEAALEGDTSRFKPGMNGVGKIDIDQRRLIWIWTRSIMNWLKLRSWQWLG